MTSYVRVSDRIPLRDDTDDRPITGSVVREAGYAVHVLQSAEATLERLLEYVGDRHLALITDDTVAAVLARQFAKHLVARGVDAAFASFPAGEASKSIVTASGLLDWLAGTSLRRRDIVIAVGGGVVTDTVGWVACTYMRGVPYINLPTTLLGQVDAALGGKVAVNHGSAKNLLGAFYLPKAILSNVAFLRTLGQRQARSGLAEAIKEGIIASPELFELIWTHSSDLLGMDLGVLAALVRSASAIKCQLVDRDPYEEDLCRSLNFGHTVGHALENVTGYRSVLHGEAVAVGMVVASRIAMRRGLLDNELNARIIALLRRVGLPTRLTDLAVVPDIGRLISALDQVRKIRDGNLRFVLPVDLGEVLIADDVSDDEVRQALLATQTQPAEAR